MVYTVYKITNKINGKFYIGQHTTNNINDDYMGSGKLIQRAQSKYGTENFSKEILFRAVSQDIAFMVESWFVDEELLKNPLCYNLKLGGRNATMTKEIKEKISKTLKGVPCSHTSIRNAKNTGAKHTRAELIRIYDANNKIIHVCFGDWSETLSKNGYSNHSFSQALATGNPMYTKGKVPTRNKKYTGWRAEKDKFATNVLRCLFRNIEKSDTNRIADYQKIIHICEERIDQIDEGYEF